MLVSPAQPTVFVLVASVVVVETLAILRFSAVVGVALTAILRLLLLCLLSLLVSFF